MRDLLKGNVPLSAVENLGDFYACDKLPSWARKSVDELIERELFKEISNRFFKNLEFGTGGMRSRTISEFITSAEKGTSKTNCPDFACVGTAYLNDFNVIGATIALFRYCVRFLKENRKEYELPSVVIAYDVRHFSKHFAELVSSVWDRLGGHAMVYPSPRSTPQLSFSVRHLHATAGVMITASHNPWYDNGFKAYFSDGAQMVDPHASGVISEFRKISIDEVCDFYHEGNRRIYVLNDTIDENYRKSVTETVLRPDLLQDQRISAIFSPLHGVGGVATIPLLTECGINFRTVDQQNDMDPNFSTVESPNPEKHEALTMAIKMAKDTGADIVLATDPDGDRLAIAAKNSLGDFEYFTGNVTGALLAEYRIEQLKYLRRIPDRKSSSAAIIKTFVTTPLIDKIAEKQGVKCINTLTGFKWIGAKMLDYEQEMLEKERKASGLSIDFDETKVDIRSQLLLDNSTLFIFGCEESYGCLSATDVRDKDANSACLMVCELAAYAKSIGKNICDLRDEMYLKYGYFGESVLNIRYEGADGAQKIKNILASYKGSMPAEILGIKVQEVIDFSTGKICDVDGKRIPSQDFFICLLEDNTKLAIRASGTEPKIKFYLFSEFGEKIDNRSHLKDIEHRVNKHLNDLQDFLREDANRRADFHA